MIRRKRILHSTEPQGLAPALGSPSEEFVNSMTHGIGLVFSIVGSVILVYFAVYKGDAWRVAGCGVYATCLVAMYMASMFSHIFSRPELKHWFRTLDQACIYLLIVATYTPFALAYLRSGWWWLFLGWMWTVALLGFFSKMLFAHRVEAVSIWIYVVLGWMPLLAGIPLVELVPATALWWMLIGGLFYTIGTVFLALDERVIHFHAVWHIFVIAGSACHFFSILFFVAQVR